MNAKLVRPLCGNTQSLFTFFIYHRHIIFRWIKVSVTLPWWMMKDHVNSTPSNLPSREHTCMLVQYLGCEVLTAVVMESSIFWDTMPCSPLKVNRRIVPLKRITWRYIPEKILPSWHSSAGPAEGKYNLIMHGNYIQSVSNCYTSLTRWNLQNIWIYFLKTHYNYFTLP
jgi:hypothetical protein